MIFEVCILILLIFLLFVGGLFYPLFLELLFNLPVMYVLYLFSYHDLFHAKHHFEYLTALFSGTIIFFFTYDLYEFLWPVTWWLILIFCIAKLEIALSLKQMLMPPPAHHSSQSGLRKVAYEPKRRKKP